MTLQQALSRMNQRVQAAKISQQAHHRPDAGVVILGCDVHPLARLQCKLRDSLVSVKDKAWRE